MNHFFSILLISSSLVGCTTGTESDRIDECVNKGISRDICYQEERADNRAQTILRQKAFEEQNSQVIKDLKIKGLGLPK